VLRDISILLLIILLDQGCYDKFAVGYSDPPTITDGERLNLMVI